MGALDWDHNAHCWPLLVGLLPPSCERVLDVGCGAGGLAAAAAVALPRVDLSRELGVELVSALGHRVIGMGRRARGQRWTAPDGMPVHDGELTVREVRRRAAAVLPGVEVRRLRYWRYLLVWREPGR